MIAYDGNVGRMAPLPPEVAGATSGHAAGGCWLSHSKGGEHCPAVSRYGGIRGPAHTYVGDRLTGEQVGTRILSRAANMPSYANNLNLEEPSSLLVFLGSRHRGALPSAMR